MTRLYMTNTHPDAPGVWTVRNFDTNELVQAVSSREHASTLLASAYDFEALTADAGAQLWESDPAIAFVGVETSDGRIIEPGALSTRKLPLPLMWQFTTSMGHDGAMIAGAVDTFEVDDDKVIASGRFDSGTGGQDAYRLVNEKIMTGVSIDMANATVDLEITEVDEDGWPAAYLEHYTMAEFAGLTGVNVPAFANARIKVAGASALPVENEEAPAAEAVTAAGGPVAPPAEWFADPEFSEPTPLIWSDDGYVRGHIATWGSCHIGRSDACVTAPSSIADYAYFLTGLVHCADNCEIPVGSITIDTGHADLGANYREASSHYDNTGTVVADVAIGEDKFGIWIAGAQRPNLDDDTLRAARGSSPSGDWRNIGNNLELVAVLAVNVPGFPVTRPQARVASGTQLALVAAASPTEQTQTARKYARLEARVRMIESAMQPLLGLAAKSLDDRVVR